MTTRERMKMKKGMNRIARGMAAGFAGLLVAGSFSAPASALPRDPIDIDPTDIIVRPPPPPPPPPTPQPDLRVEQLEVQDIGGGNWKLRAVLRNGPGGTDPTGAPYPGGGMLEIRKTS